MRAFISFFVILILFTNCKHAENTRTPKESVEAYLAATNRFDFVTAKDFLILNKENLIILETIKKMEKSIPDKEKDRFLNKEKDAAYYDKEITDSTAVIIVTPKEDIAFPIEFKLKKVNKEWLIESVIYH